MGHPGVFVRLLARRTRCARGGFCKCDWGLSPFLVWTHFLVPWLRFGADTNVFVFFFSPGEFREALVRYIFVKEYVATVL